jgi:hypothetical protein
LNRRQFLGTAAALGVDPKLALLTTTSEPRRRRREFIKPACRNRVIHIAGSDRQKLCRANRNVKLCDWCFQIANVKAIGFNIDPFLHRNDELQAARGRKYRAAPVHSGRDYVRPEADSSPTSGPTSRTTVQTGLWVWWADHKAIPVPTFASL